MGGRPKAFLPVGGMSALDHVCRKLEEAGVRRALIVHNALWAPSFDRWTRARPSSGLDVTLLNDGAVDASGRLGSVGDMRLGLAALGREDAVLMPVDTLFTYRLRSFLEAAGVSHPSIAVRAMRKGYEELGRVDVDERGVVRNFYEGRRADGGRPWCGRVWLGPGAVPADMAADVEVYCEECREDGRCPDRLGDFVAWLIRRRPVKAVACDEGEAWDVGTPGGLAEAQGALGP
jgi:NDP-sugar pyrophosphorylase family protein